jgi:hypothetical protein
VDQSGKLKLEPHAPFSVLVLFANNGEYAMIGAHSQNSSEQHKAIIEAEGGCKSNVFLASHRRVFVDSGV